MSAYQCSNTHIATIVHAADRDFQFYHDGRWNKPTRQELGQMLTDENDKSVCARYREEAHGYVYTDEPTTYHDSPIAVLKLINGYDYQACEHDGWETSAAKAAISALRNDLIRKLPGYEDAPWSI